MVWYRGIQSCNSESDSDSDDEDYSMCSYHKRQVLEDPKQVDFLKSFYGGMQFASNKIHPCLLQILQTIEEKDGKETRFFAHDHECLLERSCTSKVKEDSVEEYHSPKPVIKIFGDSTGEESEIMVSYKGIQSCNSESDSDSGDEDYSMCSYHKRQVLEDPKQVDFLKSFYGGMQFASNKIHPCLLQTLQTIEEKDGKETCFLAHDHECLLERSCTSEVKEDSVEEYYSSKLVVNNNDEENDPSFVPVAQENQTHEDCKQIQFLKSFYGDLKLCPNKVHPYLLQKLQKIEPKGNAYAKEDEVCMLAHEDACQMNNKENVVVIERGYSIETCNNEEESFQQFEDKDDDEALQDQIHEVFTPIWCLNALDDGFLCGEDIFIHSSLIAEMENPIDEIEVGCVEIHMGSSVSTVLCAAGSASAAIPKRLALLSTVKSRRM